MSKEIKIGDLVTAKDDLGNDVVGRVESIMITATGVEYNLYFVDERGYKGKLYDCTNAQKVENGKESEAIMQMKEIRLLDNLRENFSELYTYQNIIEKAKQRYLQTFGKDFDSEYNVIHEDGRTWLERKGAKK